MSERAGGTAGNPENNAPPSLQLRDLLERAIFYLGIPAVTLYPLGVLFYWIQIRSHYDISADVPWQAVFTIPREFIIAKTAAMVEGFAFATPGMLLIWSSLDPPPQATIARPDEDSTSALVGLLLL